MGTLLNDKHKIALAALFLSGFVLVGCDRMSSSGAAAGDDNKGVLTEVATNVAVEARQEIIKQNLKLRGDNVNLPEAELTPEGDLLIAGQKVAVNPEQHALLVKYRQVLESIAISGVDVGMQGVDLAGKAVSNAISNAFSGNSEQTKAQIEAEASKIKAAAHKLCDQLPALLDSQQKLAAALPEFRPYARMTTDNLKKCHVE